MPSCSPYHPPLSSFAKPTAIWNSLQVFCQSSFFSQNNRLFISHDFDLCLPVYWHFEFKGPSGVHRMHQDSLTCSIIAWSCANVGQSHGVTSPPLKCCSPPTHDFQSHDLETHFLPATISAHTCVQYLYLDQTLRIPYRRPILLKPFLLSAVICPKPFRQMQGNCLEFEIHNTESSDNPRRVASL